MSASSIEFLTLAGLLVLLGIWDPVSSISQDRIDRAIEKTEPDRSESSRIFSFRWVSGHLRRRASPAGARSRRLIFFVAAAICVVQALIY